MRPRISWLKGPRTYAEKASKLPYQVVMASWMHSRSKSLLQFTVITSKMVKSDFSFSLLLWFREIARADAGMIMQRKLASTGKIAWILAPSSPPRTTQNAGQAICHQRNIMDAENSLVTGARTILPSGLSLRKAAISKTHQSLERSGSLHRTRNSSEAFRKDEMDMIPCFIWELSVWWMHAKSRKHWSDFKGTYGTRTHPIRMPIKPKIWIQQPEGITGPVKPRATACQVLKRGRQPPKQRENARMTPHPQHVSRTGQPKWRSSDRNFQPPLVCQVCERNMSKRLAGTDALKSCCLSAMLRPWGSANQNLQGCDKVLRRETHRIHCWFMEVGLVSVEKGLSSGEEIAFLSILSASVSWLKWVKLFNVMPLRPSWPSCGKLPSGSACSLQDHGWVSSTEQGLQLQLLWNASWVCSPRLENWQHPSWAILLNQM